MTADIFFEDFPPGRIIETAGLTVTETHLVEWSNLTGDWYPLHTNEKWAREQGPFGKRVAHGPLVFALMIGLMERANVFGESLVAWLGAEDLRSTAPTFVGDTLRSRATVLEARVSRSNPTRGIVTFRYESINDHDETVMSCNYILMMRVRPA